MAGILKLLAAQNLTNCGVAVIVLLLCQWLKQMFGFCFSAGRRILEIRRRGYVVYRVITVICSFLFGDGDNDTGTRA
jgi:hypothetical protein